MGKFLFRKMARKGARIVVNFVVAIAITFIGSETVAKVLTDFGVTLDMETLSIAMTGGLMGLIEMALNFNKHGGAKETAERTKSVFSKFKWSKKS